MFSSSLVKSRPAAQALVDGPPVVLGGEPELRLDRGAQDGTAVLAEHVPLDLDPVRRSVERLHVRHGDAQVLEPQRAERLEPEHVADDRGRHVRDRALLEQVHVVGDVGDVLSRPAGDGIEPVALSLVALEVDEAVGPHRRPGTGRRLGRHRRARLLGGDAVLRDDPERRKHIGVRGHVVGAPVAHVAVCVDSRVELAVVGFGHVVLLFAPRHRTRVDHIEHN